MEEGSGWLARLVGTIVCEALSVCTATASAAEWSTGLPQECCLGPQRPCSPGLGKPSTSLPVFWVFLSFTPIRADDGKG